MVKWIIGIDEVGRGPLAGPVTLGAVMIKMTTYKKMQKDGIFLHIKDSKKLNEGKREEWRKKIYYWKKEGMLDFAVASSSNMLIDSKGLSFSINKALSNCLKKLHADQNHCLILLDGGLKAPLEFLHQQTIIKGDEKEPIISLASIIAKTTRDKTMKKLDSIYPLYGFGIHKGYGTKTHSSAIKTHGASIIHRNSFLKNIS